MTPDTADTPDAAEVERLRVARERVLERIARAAERAGRDAADVTLVAVSKTVSVDRLRAAVAAGLDLLGENRVQEAEAKAAVAGARWHLVGPLQSNKARRALETFAVIETVGSVELASRLDELVRSAGRPRFPVLLQVNVDRDPAKAGFRPDDLAAATESLDALVGLDFQGLMTVGRLVDDPESARPTFAALRSLSARLEARWPSLGPELSMGMTDDFEVAIEEGATIVRIGRAIFGDRRTT
ncbi:MAG: YggS family pyridoxal phosphate-dependent enzyme [Chloroflexota bacterium]|nr:YggS family pyridoxal phosphate-dependent enzyme [Chloroflexota bacterium]